MTAKQPETIEEARNLDYGVWTWFVPYNPDLCAFRLRWAPYFGASSYQCTNNNGHGKNGLFCEHHAHKQEDK